MTLNFTYITAKRVLLYEKQRDLVHLPGLLRFAVNIYGNEELAAEFKPMKKRINDLDE